jgi:hypothetical protein
LTFVETVAEYIVLFARGPEGVNVAVVPEYVTVPAPFAVPSFRVTVPDVIVEASIASLKLTTALLLVATDVAVLAGTTDRTFGATFSAAVLVVHLLLYAEASEFPAASLAPVETVAEYVVLFARGAEGVKVAVVPE